MEQAGYRSLTGPPDLLKFTVADAEGRELCYMNDEVSVDMDLGDTKDFELEMSAEAWEKAAYDWGHRIFIPGTEYGGLLEERGTSTEDDAITWHGHTWRGLLDRKIIQPPAGQTHMRVSGEANKIIRDIMGSRFGPLFVGDSDDSGIQVENYQFDRYCTLLEGFTKMLAIKNARLQIYYHQGTTGNLDGAVHVRAVPVADWSEQLEYSQDDGRLDFTTRDYRRGINHLICAGEGENEERIVLHLYVQEDGSIGDTQCYFGLDEREALYSYTSADMDELRKGGLERLQELMNYKQMEAKIDDVDIDIGDIVGGRDRITGMSLQKPVVNKILKIQDGYVTLEYELKGEE